MRGPPLSGSHCCGETSTGYDNGPRRPRPTCQWGQIPIQASAAQSCQTAAAPAVPASSRADRSMVAAKVEPATTTGLHWEKTSGACCLQTSISTTPVCHHYAHLANLKRPPRLMTTTSITTTTAMVG